MLRRSTQRLVLRGTVVVRHSAAAAAPAVTAASGSVAAEEQKPMVTHTRSSFSYEGSAKSEEVGARNEAAKMNYEAVNPASLQLKLAMPSYVNLLTVTPMLMEAFCVGAFAWGIFLWYIYARKNYEAVVIERPEKL